VLLDILLMNGRIVDGTGNPWRYANIGIKNGRIVSIDTRQNVSAHKIIDAQGLVIAPGFVDSHSHADFVLSDPCHPQILEGLVRQGITTLITGNCGFSPFPIRTKSDLELLRDYSSFFQSDGFIWDWEDAGSFIDALCRRGVAYNVIPLTSHGTARMCVKGLDAGVATPHECDKMAALIHQDLQQGAWGLSSGLIYPPGMYSSTDELIAVTAPLKEFRGVYTSHIRGSSETLLQASAEVIRIAQVHGITAIHSHVEAFGERFWPQIDSVLEMHAAARSRGVDVGMDVIPYVAANTTLFATLPPWALEGGMEQLASRLADPETRENIRRSVEEDMPGWPSWLPGAWPHNLVSATGWSNIRLISAIRPENARFEGMSFTEIAETLGKPPFDAAADMIMQEQGPTMALYVGSSGIDEMEDPWHQKLIAAHQVSIETDAIITGRGIPHPAGYGAFAKCLGHYTRDLQLVPMEDMIRKMTSQSLQRFGIYDRGILREGAWADITIFDEQAIQDNATYENPAQFAEGISFVLINGQVVLENGCYSPDLCGQVLKKKLV